jgi:hypothetical protein
VVVGRASLSELLLVLSLDTEEEQRTGESSLSLSLIAFAPLMEPCMWKQFVTMLTRPDQNDVPSLLNANASAGPCCCKLVGGSGMAFSHLLLMLCHC